MSTVIDDIVARKIFDSRGNETIEVDVITPSSLGRASAPSGASRGKNEVSPYPRRGIDEALKKIENIVVPELLGMNVDMQEEIDEALVEIDGTENFINIGGNTAFALSLAVAEAAANAYGLPLFQYLGGQLAYELPYPLGNVISGGKHAGDKTPDIQEFLVLPIAARSFQEAAKANTLVHKEVGKRLKQATKDFSGGRSDEGAWIAKLGDYEALELISSVCEEVSEEMGFECRVGLDIAASTLWNPKTKRYIYSRSNKKLDSGEQLEYIFQLIKQFRLVYVEDPFHEEDFKNFAELTRKTEKCLICGDDLFVTNEKRLKHGMKTEAGNAIIIKVNQVGTLARAMRTVRLAKKGGYVPIISHRSGDTVDWHIAHLAVGLNCPIIKTGIVEGARIAKINELIRIEELLGNRAQMSSLPRLG
jgi:enolase